MWRLSNLERGDVEVVVEVALLVATGLRGKFDQLAIHSCDVRLEAFAHLLLALFVAHRHVDEGVDEVDVELKAHLLHEHAEVPATHIT